MISAFEVLSSRHVDHGSGEPMRALTARLLHEKSVDVLKGTKIGVFLADIVGHVKKNLAAVPFLETVGSICQLVLTLKDERDRYMSVTRVADFATTFEGYFGTKPSIGRYKVLSGRYKVFGCPCVVKVYTQKSIDSDAQASTLNSKNLVQRGVCGVFVGFPINQAGYLVWIPTSGHLLASVDVMFDEDFTSPLSYPDRIFHDAQPTWDCNFKPPSDSITDHTGPPNVYPDDADPSLSWTPFTAIPPDDADDHLDFTNVHTDELAPELQHPSEEENYLEK
jgi:hypothetical protein